MGDQVGEDIGFYVMGVPSGPYWKERGGKIQVYFFTWKWHDLLMFNVCM